MPKYFEYIFRTKTARLMTSNNNSANSSTDLHMTTKFNVAKLGVAFFIIMGLSTAGWLWVSFLLS